MKVSSPIGELPFEPRSIRLRHGALELEGVMGAWPARVEIGVADAWALVQVARRPITVAAAGVAAASLVLGARRRRSRSRT
jgi:hypothetical protein